MALRSGSMIFDDGFLWSLYPLYQDEALLGEKPTDAQVIPSKSADPCRCTPPTRGTGCGLRSADASIDVGNETRGGTLSGVLTRPFRLRTLSS